MAHRIELPTQLQNISQEDSQRLLDEVRINRTIIDSQQNRSPYLPQFTGESKGCEFKLWKSAVNSIKTSYTTQSVIQSIRKSVQGNASKVLSNLPYDCTIEDILESLSTVYGEVTDSATSWQLFYSSKQGPKEDLCIWHTRLQSILYNIPDIDKASSDIHLKTRLFHGLYSTTLKEQSRHKFDDDSIKEAELLKYLRKLDTEKVVSKSMSSISTDSEFSDLQKQVASLSSELKQLKTREAKLKKQKEDKKETKQCVCATENDQKPSSFRQNNFRGTHQNNNYRPRYDSQYTSRYNSQYSPSYHNNQYTQRYHNNNYAPRYNNYHHSPRYDNRNHTPHYEYNRNQYSYPSRYNSSHSQRFNYPSQEANRHYQDQPYRVDQQSSSPKTSNQ